MYWMEDLYNRGGNEGARLDIIKYSTVISALGRGGHPGSAEHILRKMIDDYQNGNEEAKPDIKCFHVVLTSWSHYRNAEVAAARAQNIIGMMWTMTDEGVTPDTRAYNSVLFCWKSAKAPVQAEACLNEMKRFGVAPNRASFDSVIETWEVSGRDHSETHVHELQKERYQLFGGRNTLSNPSRRGGNRSNSSLPAQNHGGRFRKW